MKDPQTQYAHDIALFRYGVIAELVHLPPATKGLYARIAELAKRDYTVPGSERTRFAPETIRHWLKRYRHGGFEALLPKPRTDRGRSRTIPDAIAEQLLCLKEQHPALSVRLLIDRARIRGGIPSTVHLPPSTVHRLLERHGLMAKTQRPANSTDRRRFAFDKPAELWMSDVMHGPAVPDNNRRKRKAYLIAFIDDATRIIPYATFTHAENTATFLPVFKQAILRRGLPARLYVDNGANFRSQQLALRLRQTRRGPNPRTSLPATGKRKNRALVQNRSRPAAGSPRRR